VSGSQYSGFRSADQLSDWQALTTKEKDFFIGSLIKIYKKYTGGSVPELIGFYPEEEAQYKGASTGRTPNLQSKTPPSAAQSPAEVSTGTPLPNPSRSQPPYDSRAPSRQGNGISSQDQDRAASRNGYRPVTREGERAPAREEFRPPSRPGYLLPNRDGLSPSSRENSTDPRTKPSPQPLLRTQPSQERTSSTPPQFQDGRPRSNFTPQSSQSSSQNGPPIPSRATPTTTPTPSQNGLAVHGFVAKPSSESLNRSEYTPSFSSRPSTAASGRKTPPPVGTKSGPPEPPLPVDRLPVLRPKASFGQRSNRSENNTNYSTSLATPSALKSEPAALRKDSATALEEPMPTVSGSSDYFPSYVATEPPSQRPSTPNAENTSSKTDASMVANDLSASPPPMPADTQPEEEHRPGLGPMIKKKSAKDIATTFRKAALAATAFQPRAGGAGARLMAQKEKVSTEPDGVNAVVPAPLARGMSTDSAQSGTPDVLSPSSERDRPFSPVTSQPPPKVRVQRTATEDSVKPEDGKQNQAKSQTRPASPEKARSRSPGRRRRLRQQTDIEKYCNALGIDAKVIEGRGGDHMDLLEELGWDGRLAEDQTADDFSAKIRREIGRAQATGWLGHIEQQDEKIRDLGKAFDKVIEECEELDGLLTLYSHELDTLRDDVEYIEAQSQGLQVQTANQKLLQVELQSLLNTLTISPSELRALREAPLDTEGGVRSVEHALLILYQAMLKIDPDIRQNRLRQANTNPTDRSGIGVYADTELGQMRAVREKKEEYQEEISSFLRRLSHFLVDTFRAIEQRTSEVSEYDRNATANSLDRKTYEESRQHLWIHSALLLFVREVNSYEWKTLIGQYVNIKNAYQEQFREHAMGLKKTVRKATGEETEILFMTAEKEKVDEGATSRKLTMRRSKTSKNASGVRHPLDQKQDGKLDGFEVFDRILNQQSKVIAEEQNYIVAFFHLSSQSHNDFNDVVTSNRSPAQRRMPNLGTRLSYEPDREIAKVIQQAMDSMYSFWHADLHNLVDWTLSTDQLQAIGLLRSIELCSATYEETNQEYITGVLRNMHERVTSLFHRFVESQLTAIEETKVKISKRKGIISFMKTFPAFSAVAESMLPPEAGHESLEVRFIVNEAYGKINKAMWESLTFIAKEPGQGGAAGAMADPEDKEALNYHILLIENANHYIEEVETHSNVVLEEWKEKAQHEFNTHCNHYVEAVIRRPLGKWLDFLESTETLLKSNEASPTNVASKPSHSRSTAKKLLAQFDLKEVRKGVETLKKRIEKHFGDTDETTPGQALVEHVFHESSSRYAAAHDRMEAIIDTVYEGDLKIDWRKEEVAAIFKR
jgi:exocyst complex component 1